METPSVDNVDYYGQVDEIIKKYIGDHPGEYGGVDGKEITIDELQNYYNHQNYRPSRQKSPLVSTPSDFKIIPFNYFVDFITTKKYTIFGKYESNSTNITITYKDDINNKTETDIKSVFNKFINEEIETIKPIDKISEFTDQPAIANQQEIINSSHIDDKSKAMHFYALGFAQNKLIVPKLIIIESFDNYLKKYEFHNRSDLKNLLIYTVLDDTDKVINIKNFIATMKANVKEDEVYKKIFIEILDEVDRADKENKAKNEEEDITNVIDSVIVQRYPADQSVVDAIQNNIDTNKIIDIIKAESLATGEISQAKLIEIFATASGVDERQKANGRYFIAFLRKNGYTVMKDDKGIKFYNRPPTANGVVGDVKEPKEFTDYRERYEFHSKEEIAPLVYLTITDIDGEIFPEIQARIEKIKKDLDTVKESEKRSRISKFIDVLKEFKRYIDKNGVTFTNQNMANTLPMIEDFVNNLYPNYGPQQTIDNIPFYSAPSDFKKDEALESVVTSISPMRGPYAIEVDKDRYAYEKLRAEARKIDANRELKLRKLKDVAQDLARLAMLVPDDASQKYVMDTYANSALHQGMLKIVEKLTPEQKEQKKGEAEQRETERVQRTSIEKSERERELANIKRTAQEAENAFKMAEKLGKEPEPAKGEKQQGGVPPEEEQVREQEQEKQRDNAQDEPMEEAREAEEMRDEMEAETKKEEKPEKKEEDDDEKKDEEDEEEEEKDQGEMNEDMKRIKNYKKSKEKLDKIKTDIVNTENTVVRFKPFMDRYTIESPLSALDTANKDYEQTKLKINEIRKKQEDKRKIFNTKQIEINKNYTGYRGILKQEKEINKFLESIDDTTKIPNNTTNTETISAFNEATTKDGKKEVISKYIADTFPTKKLKHIKDYINSLERNVYGNVVENDDLANFIKNLYEENAASGYNQERLTDSRFKSIIEEIPSYKELKQQERDINYEIEAKKNQASVVKTELQTTVDPVEMQDQAGLLEEAKKTTSENIAQIKKIIDNTHIPKFKSMWKVSLKEITEGPSSIENLLQRLVDRTLKASKDIQTRLASIHGISSAPIEGTTSNTEYRGERENRDYRLNRELERYGGDGESNDTSDPQTIYRLLTEKLVKLKELVEQLMSFLERNTNTTALLSTNNEPSIFAQLYNKYVEDRADPKKSVLEATEGLTASAKANRVAPSDVLKIDKFDKTVFVGLTLFLRLFSLTIMEYLIDKKWIFTIEGALLSYLIAYTAIFAIFVLIVNIDMYRTRIIFNYINVHGGSMTIVGHVVMLWLFAMLLFIILRNIRFLNNPSGESYQKAMTAEERSNLKNRMSILTAAVWIFTTIMVIVS